MHNFQLFQEILLGRKVLAEFLDSRYNLCDGSRPVICIISNQVHSVQQMNSDDTGFSQCSTLLSFLAVS